MIYWAIIIILVCEFCLNRYLSYLNIQASKQPLPHLIADIYDSDKYAKQQSYFRTNTGFGMISASFNFLVTLLMVIFGGFGWLDELIRTFINNEILISLAFFGIIFVATDILNIPFELYDTFIIEQRFGFNKVTPKIFIVDKLKNYALTIAVGGILFSLIIWIYQLTPTYFWILAWAVVTFFSLFVSMFYSEIIVPIFNKQTPLEEGDLRNKIKAFANKSGFKLTDIYVIDGSKRSTKANAYFAGLGGKKRIVLYDTLIDSLTPDEITAVLAHEVGHYKKKHTLKMYAVSLPLSLLVFFLLGLILNSDAVAQALGGKAASFHLNILAFGILYTPLSIITDLLSSIMSRKHEYEADAFANSYGLGNNLISGLKKLSSDSLSNLMPHPLYVFFFYSHPTLYQRIEVINKAP